MNPDTLYKVKTFAENRAPYLLATVAPDGGPHIAAADSLAFPGNGLLEITDWFCSTTVANLQTNPRIAVVVWDRAGDTGYQLLGNVEKVEDMAIMNGYSPEMDDKEHGPQVEHRLTVRIRNILDFRLRGQSDREQ